MTRLIYQGILIGVLITMFAEGAHWFISADATAASTARRLGVLAQIIISAVLAFLVWRRAKRDALMLEIRLLSEERPGTAG